MKLRKYLPRYRDCWLYKSKEVKGRIVFGYGGSWKRHADSIEEAHRRIDQYLDRGMVDAPKPGERIAYI